MKGNTREVDVKARVVGAWRRSDECGDNGACFEVALSTVGVAVRDSKLGDTSPVLHFTPAEMRAFVIAVKAGEFDHLLAASGPN